MANAFACWASHQPGFVFNLDLLGPCLGQAPHLWISNLFSPQTFLGLLMCGSSEHSSVIEVHFTNFYCSLPFQQLPSLIHWSFNFCFSMPIPLPLCSHSECFITWYLIFCVSHPFWQLSVGHTYVMNFGLDVVQVPSRILNLTGTGRGSIDKVFRSRDMQKNQQLHSTLRVQSSCQKPVSLLSFRGQDWRRQIGNGERERKHYWTINISACLVCFLRQAPTVQPTDIELA